ncbi:MAG: hypothetical protein M1813_005571 [Trichoglossum hirsutum]|nr:MAG: hypothetical protein M1813_005571 [Trichoglossum hirsutum]
MKMKVLTFLILLVAIVADGSIVPDLSAYDECTQVCILKYWYNPGCANGATAVIVNQCLCFNNLYLKSVAACVGSTCSSTELKESAAASNTNCLNSGVTPILSVSQFIAAGESVADSGSQEDESVENITARDPECTLCPISTVSSTAPRIRSAVCVAPGTIIRGEAIGRVVEFGLLDRETTASGA